MGVLDKIVEVKRKEIELLRSKGVGSDLLMNRSCFSLSAALQKPAASGIIAEFKRKSPSKGVLHPNLTVTDIVMDYQTAGVSAVSVLTDTTFFGGSTQDIMLARKVLNIPILRKEFILDPIQVLESKLIGADAILLIAAILHPAKAAELTSYAHLLGLEVVLEIHTEEEYLAYKNVKANVWGINNRNLDTLVTDIQTSVKLSSIIPENSVMISESGIDSTTQVEYLRGFGFSGFLIGHKFMEAGDPGRAARDFVRQLKPDSK